MGEQTCGDIAPNGRDVCTRPAGHGGFHMSGETITTPTELDALPIGSVVRGVEGQTYASYVAGWYGAGRLHPLDTSTEVAFPATVLFRPDVPVAPSDDSAVEGKCPSPICDLPDHGWRPEHALTTRGGTAPTVTLEKVLGAWHDVTCPEGKGCRSRSLHALGSPADTGLLVAFLTALGIGVTLPGVPNEVTR